MWNSRTFYWWVKEYLLANIVQTGECEILGDGRQVEIQLLITLHPTLFFINLSTQAQRFVFFKTTDSRCVINVPVQPHAQYLIYFSQIWHGTF